MGKTSAGHCVALHNARAGVPTLIVSAEMSRVEVGTRILAMLSNVGTEVQKAGRLTDTQWERLADARTELASLVLEIDDRAAPTLAQVRSAARSMQARRGLGLVVVDYLQLMMGRKDAERRDVQVAELARGLKGLARDVGCVVVALAQLNRKLEDRGDKRPLLSDLRESGAIEQDADVVMFIYRDEVYSPKAEHGVAEVIVAKHRSGPTGVARLAWLPTVTRFADLAEQGARW
jgi:replicative DNA helicase